MGNRGQDYKNITARTKQRGQDSEDRPRLWDSCGRTVRIGHQEQDHKDSTAGTDQSGKVSLDG
jgi:hypothetical protein